MRNAILLLSLTAMSFGLRAEDPIKLHPNDATKSTDNLKTSDSKRWKTGYIVTLKGDTIQGKIKSLDFLDAYYDYQKVVSFQDAKGISQYSPNDLKAFSFFENPTSEVTMQAVSSPEGTGKAFLRLYVSGPCRVYGLTVTELHSATASGTDAMTPAMIQKEKKYIQIKSSQFFPLRRAGFKKNMKEVFASYPKIVAGLESNQYTYAKWENLVKDYNQMYK